MTDKIEQERFEYSVLQPFVPVRPTGPSPEAAAQVRIAHALEYIAAQLFVIAENTTETETHSIAPGNEGAG